MDLIFSIHLIIAVAIFCNASPLITSKEITISDKNDVIFFLYTRENLLEPIQLTENNLERVDSSKPTKFIIHGFFENSGKGWYRYMTSEYLKKGDYNVIQVDWSKRASSTYGISASNTEPVGAIIGRLIANLHQNYELSLDEVHIIGHSLGAQVAGYTGKEVIKQTGSPVGRITALDAAGPLFEAPIILLEGLSKKDAQVVDAIHTDGGIFGRRNSIGTVDFYPNGGFRPQPACTLGPMNLPLWNYVEMLQDVFCSHTMSYYYFINSINKENFIGIKCDSWEDFKRNNCNEGVTAIMGDNYDYTPKTTGRFFLRTNAQSPYSQNS